MGKQRNRKRFSGGSVRPNPLSNGHSNDVVANGQQQDKGLATMLAQLQSASSEDRECGLTSLCQLEGERAVSAINDFKLVRVAGPLLVDKNLSVKHTAVGALKNLSLVSADLCEVMVEQDIMTPLCGLFATYTDDWSPAPPSKSTISKNASNEAIDSKSQVFIEAVNLLWNVCEASPLALKIVNENQILPFLLKHLDVAKFGAAIVTPVLQCIYSLTEDNPDAATIIQQRTENLKPFLQVVVPEASNLHLSILSYGIFVNSDRSETLDLLLPGLLNTISIVLDRDQRSMLHTFTSMAPMDDGGRGSDLEDKSDPATETLMQEIQDVVFAQQTALEILTNLVCDDTSADWDEDCSDDEEESMVCDAASGGKGSSSSLTALHSLPPVVLEAITSLGLVEKVLAKTILPAANVCEMLESNKKSSNFVKMVTTLRSRAFLCFNNLVQVLTVEDIGGQGNLFRIWSEIGKQCFQGDDSLKTDPEFFDAATSALRAITQKLQDSKSDVFAQSLTVEDTDKILLVGSASSDTRVRMNIVNLVGNLGLMFMAAGKLPELKSIVNFLLEASTRDVELIVVAEAIDKIIDLFSEDETDNFCAEINLLTRLKQILPGLKVKIGQLKCKVKKSDENLGVILMAKNNLNRFIKYKEKRPSLSKK